MMRCVCVCAVCMLASELKSDKKDKKGAASSSSPRPASASTSQQQQPQSSAPPSSASASSNPSASAGAAADGVDGSTLSPSSGAEVDLVLANLDKPLTRLPELTSPAAVASNPFGEKFKKSNPQLSVDDFELLKVIGKGSFVRNNQPILLRGFEGWRCFGRRMENQR